VARVLIVEDEFLHQSYLEQVLRANGHTVCAVVSTAADAVILARTRQPDVAVIDVKLKGGSDGITAAEQIVAERPCGLVFLSGFATGENKARMEGLSADAILSKPCPAGDIIRAVEQAAPPDIVLMDMRLADKVDAVARAVRRLSRSAAAKA